MSGQLKRAHVIIPAHNEAERIGDVIEVARQANPDSVVTDNIIVVDNDSNDGTNRAARLAGAHTILACGRLGKGWAMRCAANYIDQSLQERGPLLFLDADLRNLQPEHVTRLARPVIEGNALMTIGCLGTRSRLSKSAYDYWGALSGQRCVSRASFNALRESDFEAWRIEGALNAVHRNAGMGRAIQRVELDGVSHIGQFEKNGYIQGTVNYARIYLSGLRGLMSTSALPGSGSEHNHQPALLDFPPLLR